MTTPTFEKEFNKLKKRYPKIDDDLEKFLDEVEIQGDLGDPLKGILQDGNNIFKKRMVNSSAKKGLSGGFRIIHYLVTKDKNVFLLDIYSKSNQENISKLRVSDLIKRNEDRF